MSFEPLDLTQAAPKPVVDMEWPCAESLNCGTDAPYGLCARIAVRLAASDFHNHSKTTTDPGAGWDSSRGSVDIVYGL